MRFVIVAAMAGVIATAGMTTVLWLITRSGRTNADMVRALGSFITRSYHNSLLVGTAIHFGAGIPIAMLYIVAFQVIRVESIASMMLAGAAFGFFHGFAFSFVMLTISEYHPVDKFHKADFQVAFAHLLGHVVFGILVGLMVGISGYQARL